MEREQRKQIRRIKRKFARRDERDMFGTPRSRAKTWGSRLNTPKSERRRWKTQRTEF